MNNFENKNKASINDFDLLGIVFDLWSIKIYILVTGIIFFTIGYLTVTFQNVSFKDSISVYPNNSLKYNVSSESLKNLKKNGISTELLLEQFVETSKNNKALNRFIEANSKYDEDLLSNFFYYVKYTPNEIEINKQTRVSYYLEFSNQINFEDSKELIYSYIQTISDETFDKLSLFIDVSVETVKKDVVKYNLLQLEEMKSEKKRIEEAIVYADLMGYSEMGLEEIEALDFDATKIPLHLYGGEILRAKLKDIDDVILLMQTPVVNSEQLTSTRLSEYEVPNQRSFRRNEKIQRLIEMEFVNRDFQMFLYDKVGNKLDIVTYDPFSIDREVISFFPQKYKYYIFFIGCFFGAIFGLLVKEFKRRKLVQN